MPWTVTLVCEMVKTSCLMGRHLMRGDSVNHLMDQEFLSDRSKDQSRLHRIGENVLPGIFPGYVSYAGDIWRGDIHGRGH